MNNRTALQSLCNAIANTFYPDCAAVELVLFNAGVDPNGEATPKDPQIFRAAISLLMGYVESSHSEASISTNVREDAIVESIKHWCKVYNLEADEVLSDYQRVIEDGSNLW